MSDKNKNQVLTLDELKEGLEKILSATPERQQNHSAYQFARNRKVTLPEYK